MQPFHLAFPVTDLKAARSFYVDVLGCAVGREDTCWIDFDFFGHQITAHLVPDRDSVASNPVDGQDVPSRHFGLVMGWDQWSTWTQRLLELNIEFLMEPTVRFAGEIGEQGTCFVADPSGNALEFKSFKDPQQLFARREVAG